MMTCRKCGGPGHFAKTCWVTAPAAPRRARTATVSGVTTVPGDLVIVTLRMREIKIENLSTSPQNVTVFLEIIDGSNAVINGDADDHWTFPLSAAGGGAAFVVVPVNIIAFDTPSAGSHTYKGRWRVSGSVDSSVKMTNANSRRLQAIRTKR